MARFSHRAISEPRTASRISAARLDPLFFNDRAYSYNFAPVNYLQLPLERYRHSRAPASSSARPPSCMRKACTPITPSTPAGPDRDVQRRVHAADQPVHPTGPAGAARLARRSERERGHRQAHERARAAHFVGTSTTSTRRRSGCAARSSTAGRTTPTCRSVRTTRRTRSQATR